uniref:SHSP domain-containing protein n=1 Tax=Nelumbo nucifera TaxID=4432 RepID=A0A822ZHJ1_NELNU|nr:TPA_asm: hypothetical protein HUJ06_001135 [Nelumbo nucifera]
MSIIPSIFGGRRSNIFDPFSMDLWDPFHDFTFTGGNSTNQWRALLENARVDQVKAAVENGVLTVTVPKEEVKKPEVKAIEISG